MTQRFYYSGNSNYLCATTSYQYADGYNRFNKLNSTNYSISSYPAYVPNYTTYNFSNNYRNLNITYNCNKYMSAYLTDITIYNVSVTFSSNGGHVYGTSSV